MANDGRVKALAQAAMVCALLMILGMFPGIPLGIIPVAVVLQNLGMMLAGELLPPRAAAMAVGVFLVLIAMGLPLLSGGRGGVAVFVGPTGGYLAGWLLAPPLNAWLLRRFAFARRPAWQEFVLAALLLVGFSDLLGSLWLAHQSQMPLEAALLSNLAFIPGDLLKLGLAVVVARRLRRIV